MNGKHNLYIGIDPGNTGAIAAIDDKGNFISVHDAPILKEKKKTGGIKTTLLSAKVAEILNSLCKGKSAKVIIEQALVMPMIPGRNGGQGTVSAFSFGYGAGIYEGVLSGLGLEYLKVLPQTWKKAVFSGSGGGADKRFSIVLAKAVFPGAISYLNLAKHDGRAEALLLAEYLRRLKKYV